ncbi:g10912 [Coccomyxa elongata]
MPEEMVSVYRAAKRGYALVALGAHLSEAERNFHCFNTTWPPERHIELPELVRTLRHVLSARDWWHLPRFAFGSSRGGAMTLILALRFPFQAVGSMVMGMRPEEVMEAELQPRNLASGALWAFPPTLLMAARNDQDEIIDLINRTATHLEGQGVLVQKMMMEPYPLSPEFFSQRMKGIDLDTSTAIFEELKAAGIIRDDNQSHFGLFETWKKAEAQLRKILLKHFPADLGVKNGSRGYERAFREMLWASEAIHELTAEHMDEMLDFFESSAVTAESPLHDAHPFVQLPAEAGIDISAGVAAQPGKLTEVSSAQVGSSAEGQSEVLIEAAARPGNSSEVETARADEDRQSRHTHAYKHHSHAHALGEVRGLQTTLATG